MVHFIERIVEEVAEQLGVTAEELKAANIYQDGQTDPNNVPITPCYCEELWNQLKTSVDFDKRAADINTFNTVMIYHLYICLFPVCITELHVCGLLVFRFDLNFKTA